MSNAPALSMNTFPSSSSSAGVPKIWMVPGSFCSMRARFAATPAATADVPSRLCPHPCPGAPSFSGSFFASPGFCDSPGSASYSAMTATTGAPLPAVAMNAVGIPATLRSTLKPSFWSRSSMAAADLSSWRPVSAYSHSWRDIPSQRVRVWSR